MGNSKTKYITKFIYKNLNLENINNYNDIEKHFKNFIIESEYNKFLKNKVNKNSVSFLNFILRNHENFDILNLFTIEMNYDRTKSKKYIYKFKKNIENKEEDFLKYLEENKDKRPLYISVEMETTFLDPIDSESEYEEYKIREKEKEINWLKEKIKELEIILEDLINNLHDQKKLMNNKFFSSEKMEKRKNLRSAIIVDFLKGEIFFNERKLECYNEELKKLKE